MTMNRHGLSDRSTLLHTFMATLLALALIAGVGLSVSARAEAPGTAVQHGSVGVVSLLLGKASVRNADNTRRDVRIGSQIHPGDHIITEANGHVHIRFVDDALVSIRPNSRLVVTDYHYNDASPSDSVVRFSLVEGVTRSISGEAGRSARERFRLDTPIAAIGVRGTDFVVSASPNNVRALVNEGAIVVTPYSDACIAGTLGPCINGGVELASSSMQIVEIARGQLEPVLHPRPEQELHELIDNEIDGTDERRAADESAVVKDAASDVYMESAAIRQVVQQTETSSERPPNLVASVLPPDELRQRQLTWGRWVGADETLPPGIDLAFSDARVDRNVAVPAGEHLLYRSEPDGPRVDSGLGEVGFTLDAAQAVHHGVAGVEAMSVRGGDLRINFNQSTFATVLNLDSNATGRIDFVSSGQVSANGFFVNRSASKNISGAVSTDGREAGYFFDQQLGSGRIQGITLWGTGP
jgi:hypothetical protein